MKTRTATPGELAYLAWVSRAKTRGAFVSTWEALPTHLREAWEHVAREVTDAAISDHVRSIVANLITSAKPYGITPESFATIVDLAAIDAATNTKRRT